MATSNNFSPRFLLIFGLLASQSMAAQDRSIRSIESVRLEHPISVDGQLDDTGWNKVPVAGDFTQLSPHPFESPSHQTHVRFAYDDDALYIGARMWDSAPDSILHQLSQRDYSVSISLHLDVPSSEFRWTQSKAQNFFCCF